jgi:uncharacterized Zn finger protein
MTQSMDKRCDECVGHPHGMIIGYGVLCANCEEEATRQFVFKRGITRKYVNNLSPDELKRKAISIIESCESCGYVYKRK